MTHLQIESSRRSYWCQASPYSSRPSCEYPPLAIYPHPRDLQLITIAPQDRENSQTSRARVPVNLRWRVVRVADAVHPVDRWCRHRHPKVGRPWLVPHLHRVSTIDSDRGVHLDVLDHDALPHRQLHLVHCQARWLHPARSWQVPPRE